MTDEDLKQFKDSFLEYVDLFQLNDFNYNFGWTNDENAAAQISINGEGRSCFVCLCEKVSSEYFNDYSINEWALHEAIHVLLADFHHLSLNPAVPEDVLTRVNESLVVKMTNIFNNILD